MTIVLMALPEEEPVVVVAADEEGVLPPPPPDDPPVVALPEPDDPPPEDPPELLAPPPQPASARARIRTSAASASVPFIVPSLLAEAVESAQTIILATPKLAERDGSGRHDSQLLHHGKVVPHRPVLRHLALDHAEPVRLLGGDAPARGRDTHQLALVRADHRTPHRHRLPVGGGVLDLETVVGEDAEQPLPDVPGPATLVRGGCGRVVYVLGRDEPVDGVEVVLVPDLLDVAAHHSLVFFRCRACRSHSWSPFFAASNYEEFRP